METAEQWVKSVPSYNNNDVIVFIVNFEQISHIVLVFYSWLWTSKYQLGQQFICCYIADKKIGKNKWQTEEI